MANGEGGAGLRVSLMAMLSAILLIVILVVVSYVLGYGSGLDEAERRATKEVNAIWEMEKALLAGEQGNLRESDVEKVAMNTRLVLAHSTDDTVVFYSGWHLRHVLIVEVHKGGALTVWRGLKGALTPEGKGRPGSPARPNAQSDEPENVATPVTVGKSR